jgi:hypothetical protein
MEETEGAIFCEICGAADADPELGLCPNCLGESPEKGEEEDKSEDNN